MRAIFLTSLVEAWISGGEGVDVMEPGKWALQALANIEGETRELVHAGEASTPKCGTDVEIAPLVQKVGAISIAEIEKLIGELQEAKDFLQSEGERVQGETERYTNFTQMASASVKIISDTVAGWRGAGLPPAKGAEPCIAPNWPLDRMGDRAPGRPPASPTPKFQRRRQRSRSALGSSALALPLHLAADNLTLGRLQRFADL